jgi:hypothetical protein
MSGELLQLHLFASIWMTAIIWYVQLVHYPSFNAIDSKYFCEFHAQHSRRTTLLVLVPMLVELLSATSLVWISASGASLALGALTLLTWTLTFLISVPLHNRLASGKDQEAIRRLIQSNWPRTLTWTLKLFLVYALQSGRAGIAP